MSGTTHVELRTERLILRRWRPEDREPFAALNADPEVMHFFMSTLSREESDAIVDRIEAHFAEHGFCFWALEVPGVTPFAGFVGMSIPRFEAHFTPCVEIGWRLAREYWGRGYATEGAAECLRYAFEELRLPEVVSYAVVANERSRAVMERLGMAHDPADDFDHPGLPDGHPLRRHALYRIKCEEYARRG